MGSRSKSGTKQPKPGLKTGLVVAVAILAGLVYFAWHAPRTTPPRAVVQNQAIQKPIGEVPPYYENPEDAKPFPMLLPASHFPDDPVVARAYEAASEIPEMAAQQPCYCFCAGHRSLLDCYSSNHAAG